MQPLELILYGQQLRGATMLDLLDLIAFFAMLLSPCVLALRCILLSELSSEMGLPMPEETHLLASLRAELAEAMPWLMPLTNSAREHARAGRQRILCWFRLGRRLWHSRPRLDLHSWMVRRRQGRSAAGPA